MYILYFYSLVSSCFHIWIFTSFSAVSSVCCSSLSLYYFILLLLLIYSFSPTFHPLTLHSSYCDCECFKPHFSQYLHPFSNVYYINCRSYLLSSDVRYSYLFAVNCKRQSYRPRLHPSFRLLLLLYCSYYTFPPHPPSLSAHRITDPILSTAPHPRLLLLMFLAGDQHPVQPPACSINCVTTIKHAFRVCPRGIADVGLPFR